MMKWRHQARWKVDWYEKGKNTWGRSVPSKLRAVKFRVHVVFRPFFILFVKFSAQKALQIKIFAQWKKNLFNRLENWAANVFS